VIPSFNSVTLMRITKETNPNIVNFVVLYRFLTLYMGNIGFKYGLINTL
jgi:hypothetical protein